ncbi:MAG: hypothetical protein AMXMBFR23_05070 [Chloroflexota bacterium]
MEFPAPLPDRDTLDLLPEGVMVADASGRIVEVNRALCDLLGFTREELLAMAPNDIVPPDERDDTRATRLGFLESGRAVQSVTGRRLRKDGTSIPLEATLGRLPDVPGEPARYVSVFHEVLPPSDAVGGLHGREAFLRTILDNSQNGIWIIDNFGHAFYSNPAMAAILGYTVDEFLDLSIERRVHPDEVDRIRGYTEARIAGREAPTQYRTRLLHRDGRTVWVDRSITVLRRGDQFAGILVEHRDVSADVAREEAERAAHLAEIARLERLVDSFQSGIVITDTAGQATFVNRSMAAMLGYTVEEYRALTAEQRLHPDDLPWIREMVLGRMRGEEQPDSYRVRMLHRDGHVVWMERRVSTLTAEGRIIGALAENRDVTEELQRAEREAAAQQAETARLRRLLDTFRVGVTIRDNAGRTLFCNPAMASMLGYTIEEFMARPILDHVAAADRARVEEFGRLRRAGLPAPDQYRVRLVHRDGHTVWVSRSVSVLTGEAGVAAWRSMTSSARLASATPPWRKCWGTPLRSSFPESRSSSSTPMIASAWPRTQRCVPPASRSRITTGSAWCGRTAVRSSSTGPPR